ncbi:MULTISPECIES: DUF930 domain-containing protein [unclassified Sinorhizobium]|uniref:DUF930 domain-containing protein n=1 Tax=unclassified Sinorhizobium TaxID=2613772 RepID=UPI0035247BA9
MELAEEQLRREVGWSVPASLGLHLIVCLLLLLFLPHLGSQTAPPEEGITVQIVSAPSLPVVTPERATPKEVLQKPEITPSEPPPREPNPSKAPAKDVPPILPPAVKEREFTEAKQFFSEKVLSNPRSKHAREALRQLSAAERNLQLCDLEALEQISRSQSGPPADLVAPYAMAAEKVTADGVEVKGGAFRAGKKWYGLKFKCALDARSGKVVSFAFAIGAPIPEGEWQAHDLVAEDGPDD